MSVRVQSTLQAIQPVVFDLYRDIHKGIRSELFAVTMSAGRIDPGDRADRANLAHHVGSVLELLVAHAEHEDACIDETMEAHIPALAERIQADHAVLEARIAALAELARENVEAPGFAQRSDTHRIYVELASFTSAYLEHQDLEERTVMPALEQAVGVDAVVKIHAAILASLAPDEMARSLALMLPAMNVDDRTDMLGAAHANAPAEAFAAMWNVAASVLTPTELGAVGRRLDIP